MTTTTHKYHGIRKACSESRSCRPYGMCLEIAYDPAEDRVLTELHVDSNSQVIWADGIITVCFAHHPMTMAEIRESVDRALA